MATKSMERNGNSYKYTLDTVVRARYEEKLKIIGGSDPYELNVKSSFSDDKKLLPGVTYPDIVNYLLFSPSPYTTDDLKSLKSLEAYNQAQNGWVSDVRAIVFVINSRHVIRSKVLHSMRLREKPLNPWSIVEPSGIILASHCDCMAGLGEVCTHVAAMLFTVMEIVRIRDSTTVTQDPAYWKLPPSLKGVEYKEVRDIDFTSAKSLKRKFEKVLECSDSQENVTSPNVKKTDKVTPTPTDGEVKTFFRNLHATGTKSSILSLIEEYSEEFVPAIEKLNYPKILSSLKERDSLSMDYGSLLNHIDKIEISVSADEVENVERATREQSRAKLWYNFRAGRITASRSKQVCSTDVASPSQSLIMSVCYPEAKQFVTSATQWGVKNEKTAKERFLSMYMSECHENVKMSDCGLYISENKPFMAATPDATISCDCCGPSVVEVKCPYNQRASFLDKEIENFYLKFDKDGTLSLDKSHAYYYQVQTQLGVTHLQSAYFVVMTELDIHVEQIFFDEPLWNHICTSSEKFFKLAIMPELVGKFYSRLPGCGIPTALSATQHTDSGQNVQSEEKWCYCDQVESGQMIACDNENCKITWFHFTCLKLDKPPRGKKWFCPDCRKLEFRRKTNK